MFDVFVQNLPYLLRATLVTLQLGIVGIVAGTLLGIGFGVAAVLAPRPIRGLVTAYVFIVRGVPVLVWMFLGYYGLSGRWSFSDYGAVLFVLIAYTGAFATEITRAGILSVPRQQIEAAKSLGMRWHHNLRLVILPQAVKLCLPALVNNSVMMLKQSSYVSVVGVWELSYAAREVVERTLAPFQIFLGVMLMYFLMCYPLALLARRLENRFSYLH